MTKGSKKRAHKSGFGRSARWSWLFAFAAVSVWTACAQSPAEGSGSVAVWMTSSLDDSLRLKRMEDLAWSNEPSQPSSTFVVDPARTFQSMDGFGASMSEASAVLIQKTDAATQKKILDLLFDRKTGIGISVLRQPIGSSDFSLSFFTYADDPQDVRLEKFSIDRDRKTTVPLLLQAQKINPELRLFATPWSPPAWMKSGKSLLGGSGGTLLPEHYGTYAHYLVRYLTEYEKLGLPISVLTVQNEPLYAPAGYPGMLWSAQDQIAFVADRLGPALKAAGLKTKIAAYDHNWDNVAEARTLLSSSKASPWIAGSAWHYYGGSAEAMSSVHSEFPQKDIWFTEGGSGSWIGDGSFRGTFRDGMRQSIRIVRNWSKTVVWWNLVLNPHGGPNAIGDPSDPFAPNNTANYGLLTVDERTGSLLDEKRAGYYTLGHWSKFVRPGAVRVDSTNKDGELETSAFRNPDGSFVLVAFNPTLNDRKFVFGFEGRTVSCPIAGESAVTLVWSKSVR